MFHFFADSNKSTVNNTNCTHVDDDDNDNDDGQELNNSISSWQSNLLNNKAADDCGTL